MKRPRKTVEKEYTFAKEALWCTIAAASLVLGIVAYVMWSFHAKGYVHIYMSVLLIALLCIIVAAMFVNLWWPRRRTRRHADRRHRGRRNTDSPSSLHRST